MVKNKKMSKTSIAVIVLAVLLVLSLVMGLTGAWFTAKDGKVTNIASMQFRDNAMSVEVSYTNNGKVHVYRDTDGDGVYNDDGGFVEIAEEDYDDLMPGDQIVGDDITVRVSTAAEKAVYAALKDGSKWYVLSVSEGHLVKGAELTENGANLGTVTGQNLVLAFDGGEAILNKLSLNARQGQTVATTDYVEGYTLTTNNIEVRLIQSENIDAATAYGIIVNGTWSADGQGAPQA